tara:strand:- start:670 stop:849 length:180 start_codon:yes stop_codon:yes gene_type:complete
MFDALAHKELPWIVAVEHVPLQGILKRGNIPVTANADGKKKEENPERSQLYSVNVVSQM